MASRPSTTVLFEDEASAPGAAGALRWFGVWVLAAAVLGGVLAFGAVRWWAWGALWGLAALSFLVTLAVWMIEGRATLALPPAAAAAAVLALAAAAQLLPIGTRAAAIAGGRTLEVYRTLTGGRPARLTLCPGGTAEALFKTTLVLMAAVSAAALPRSRKMLFTLAGAVAAAATVASAVGMIQENGSSEKVYGIFDLAAGATGSPAESAALDPALSSGAGRMEAVDAGGAVFFRKRALAGDVFGPYANSNHFGGLIEIALPVLFALLLGLWEIRSGWMEEGGITGTTEGNLALFAAFAIGLGVTALVWSHSFGAAGGLTAGFATVISAGGRTRRRTWGALAIAAAFAAVGLAAVLLARGGVFAQLPGVLSSKWAGRAEMWRATLAAVRDFPIVGSGLGSFAAVIPHYEQTEVKYFFAHNDYLQMAMEVGVPAAGLVGALALWQARKLHRGALRKDDVYCAALSLGALGSAAALAVHSFFDFNLHVPANALALAVILSVGTAAASAVRLDIETVGFEHRIILSGRRKVAALAAAAAVFITTGAAALAREIPAYRAKDEARAAIAGLGAAASGEKAAGAARLCERLAAASRRAPFDDAIFYQAATLAAVQAQYGRDGAESSAYRQQSVRDAVAAARLAPGYTFYALTAVTLGVRDNGVVENWPMQSFFYKREEAQMLFAEGRTEDGLSRMREALALAAGDKADYTGEVNAAVAWILARLGTYERIAEAAPDTFGGHVAFAGGLAAAGVRSAAVEEYKLAAGRAEANRRDQGLTERKLVEVGETLVSYGEAQAVLDMYKGALEQNADWQYARLNYAQLLASRGRKDEAAAEAAAVLSSDAADWLKAKANTLKIALEKK